MTHEYVIALGGRIEGTRDGSPATAVAWAGDRILAVGPDDVVIAISRGDSTFLDLDGRTVRSLSSDTGEAGGLIAIEAGSPADLLFLEEDRPVATLRAGRFTDGDPRAGPFQLRRP